jgi:hypothetical protein
VFVVVCVCVVDVDGGYEGIIWVSDVYVCMFVSVVVMLYMVVVKLLEVVMFLKMCRYFI